MDKKLKVGFVTPHNFHNYDTFRIQPLNILHFLTIIENHFGDGVETSLVDLRTIPEKDILYYISEKDVYFYSVTSLEYLEIIRTVNEIRKVYPKSKHVAGGIHINIYPKESEKHFDAIALGDGENTIINVINDVKNDTLQKVYIEKNVLDINLFPHPDRKFLPRKSVVNTGLLNGEYYNLLSTSVLFSRGCPFNCSFCANLIQSKSRFRSPELITKEIEYLKNMYDINALAIKDDNIISSNVKCSIDTFSIDK